MKISPDDLAAVLAGARKCSDASRDQYFMHVAGRIKYFGEPLDKAIADAVQRFGTNPRRPKRRDN